MLRLQRDCGVQRHKYLTSAFNFLDKFVEQTVEDRDRVGALVEVSKHHSKKTKKKSNAAREEYGKLFVSQNPHNSDEDDDVWDSDIEASSSVDAETEATEAPDADAMTVD